MNHPPLRALLWRWRHLLSAVFLALACVMLVAQVNKSAPEMESVVVVRGQIHAGHTVGEGDLEVIDVPEEFVPPDSFSDAGPILGERVVTGLPPGTVVTRSLLVTDELARSAPPGTVVVSTVISTPVELVLVGSIVDVYAPPPDVGLPSATATLLARDAVVLHVESAAQSGGFGMSGTNVTTAYLAVPEETANLILGQSARTPLMVVLSWDN